MFSIFLIVYMGAIVLGCSFMIYILMKYNINGVINLEEKPCTKCNKKHNKEEELATYGLT